VSVPNQYQLRYYLFLFTPIFDYLATTAPTAKQSVRHLPARAWLDQAIAVISPRDSYISHQRGLCFDPVGAGSSCEVLWSAGLIGTFASAHAFETFGKGVTIAYFLLSLFLQAHGFAFSRFAVY